MDDLDVVVSDLQDEIDAFDTTIATHVNIINGQDAMIQGLVAAELALKS